jgi:hypothetical protein|tara:strand:- start:123 stop:317 length:195 start_codon:yes stop_codon:yes gene_type:complete
MNRDNVGSADILAIHFKEALNRHDMTVKYLNGQYALGRKHGALFDIVRVSPSLSALADQMEGLK